MKTYLEKKRATACLQSGKDLSSALKIAKKVLSSTNFFIKSALNLKKHNLKTKQKLTSVHSLQEQSFTKECSLYSNFALSTAICSLKNMNLRLQSFTHASVQIQTQAGSVPTRTDLLPTTAK